MATMSFDDASATVLASGRHFGKTIGDVGVTLEGLEYLAWLRNRGGLDAGIYMALTSYLANPAIRADLDELYGRTSRKEI